MNKKHKWAEVIKAWADGAEVQGCLIGNHDWHDLEFPVWRDPSYQYRIKPIMRMVAANDVPLGFACRLEHGDKFTPHFFDGHQFTGEGENKVLMFVHASQIDPASIMPTLTVWLEISPSRATVEGLYREMPAQMDGSNFLYSVSVPLKPLK